MADEIAALNFAGKLTTVVEEPQHANQEVKAGAWEATISFGYPQSDQARALGTPDAHGRVLIGQLGPDEFVVTGIDGRVSFHLPGRPLPSDHHLNNILRAEEGEYIGGVWHATSIWNGDEIQRGLNFHHDGAIIHVKLYTWPGI